MRHLRLIFELFVITFVMYVIRPIEAFVVGTYKGIVDGGKTFWDTWKYKMWYTSNLTPKDFYKTSIHVWKEKKNDQPH